MNQSDIEYVLELLEDAIDSQDWDLVEEAKQYMDDFLVKKKPSKYDDDE